MVTDTFSEPTATARLMQWLDDGADTHGERYRELRRRLVGYFDRKNCEDPEELADETFLRIACTLEDGRAIDDTTPAQHCYDVARMVFLETLDCPPAAVGAAAPDVEDDVVTVERRLQELPLGERVLVVEYYRHPREQRDERRHRLAARMGITPAVLAKLAGSIRARLESPF
jgi:hypothetical protein